MFFARLGQGVPHLFARGCAFPIDKQPAGSTLFPSFPVPSSAIVRLDNRHIRATLGEARRTSSSKWLLESDSQLPK